MSNEICDYLESDDKPPFAAGVLSPVVGGHEWPVGEAIPGVIILWSPAQNHTSKEDQEHFRKWLLTLEQLEKEKNFKESNSCFRFILLQI